MKIELFLRDKVIDFELPSDISGSYSFDEVSDTESKLINVEARENKWVLYSTEESKIISNNTYQKELELQVNNFYILNKSNNNYLIYVSSIVDNTFYICKYDDDLNLSVSNSNTNCVYRCEYINNLVINFTVAENKVILENKNNSIIYVNSYVPTETKVLINKGDIVNIFGLKIIFMDKMILLNNPGGRVVLNEIDAKLSQFLPPESEKIEDIQFIDEDLYKKSDYFQKAPRIRRIIENKIIKLSPPPAAENNQDLPLILTLGPMITMGAMSFFTAIDTINKINRGETTMKDSWTSLASAGMMLVSMILWPLLTKWYNDFARIRRRKNVVKKYTKYLEEKEKEFQSESYIQKGILVENLIDLNSCLRIIASKKLNFWDKRIDQSDFLTARIGVGNEKLKVEVEYPEEGFSIDEDKLKKQVDELVEKYKYINNVPIGYSFYENKITAVMGEKHKTVNFISNIILQLITFYSYEDLRIALFTNELDEKYYEYIKFLSHNFHPSKKIRFFSQTVDSAKFLAEVINNEFDNRMKFYSDDKPVYEKPYYLIIVDDYDRVKNLEVIKKICEIDKNYGFSLLILGEKMNKLPSKCSNFIMLGKETSWVLKNSYEKQEQYNFSDEINYNINMMDIAKITSNIPIEFENNIAHLPEAINFLEMEKAGKVEQLNILNRWNNNNSIESLKAEIGVDENGELMYLDLHEKAHGPHGLIAGMTGSGKSEFIITYILSMAINYSPDDVAFILIDYKGGGLAGAFENKTQGIVLPHLAGTITNLDKAEMDRTLVSINSEVQRRQRVFNKVRDALGESTIDIYKYQKFYKEGKIKESVPHLFIVCDEFAELKSQQPDFMDNLISVARIGRSLGVHLILATQKPSGVVDDQIWSNTKFRVCLKVQDESDSKEMLKRPEAASLKQTGRFYLQVGYDELFLLGQSAWCGAKYYPSDKIVRQVDKSINFIDDCGRVIKSIQAGNGVKLTAQGEQLSAILNSIIEVAKRTNKFVNKMWLDNVPSIIYDKDLRTKYNVSEEQFNVEAVIGEYDAPENQEQGIVKYNFVKDGNTLIYGLDGGERELLLSTIIYSSTLYHKVDEINYYIVDYGSESLRKFENLPQVGGMVFSGDEEKYNNLLKLIKEEIQKRKKLFVDYGGEYLNYIKKSSNKLPLMAVIFNNFDSIFDEYQDSYEVLPELFRDSERYGIVYIVTASMTSSISSKIQQNFKNSYAFRLKDASEYQDIFGIRTNKLPMDIDGRGLFKNKNESIFEFQTAHITKEEDMSEYILQFVGNQTKINSERATSIPSLPEKVDIEKVKDKISSLKNLPIGIRKKSLEIATINLEDSFGYFITSNKLSNMHDFVISLNTEIRKIKDNISIVIDPYKMLQDNKLITSSNYSTNDFDKTINNINSYIEKLSEKKSSITGIIIIYGFDKFYSRLEDTSIVETLFETIKKYEKFTVIIFDEANKISNYNFENWFSQNFEKNNSIWIGRGIQDQSAISLSVITNDMTANYKNDMGYIIEDGLADLCKLIDFTPSKEAGDTDGK